MDYCRPKIFLLVAQNPFNLYIASNFVLPAALNSILFWVDAYVNFIFAVASKTPVKFHVYCCESMSIQALYVL